MNWMEIVLELGLEYQDGRFECLVVTWSIGTDATNHTDRSHRDRISDQDTVKNLRIDRHTYTFDLLRSTSPSMPNLPIASFTSSLETERCNEDSRVEEEALCPSPFI